MSEGKQVYVVLRLLSGSVKRRTTVCVSDGVEGGDVLLVVVLNHLRTKKAEYLKTEWMKSSRGIRNRLKQGALLSLKNNLQCYAPSKILRKYKLKKYKNIKCIGK